eukprot:CAMPEP_0178464456 /NCGR_PEP_ID=MMETSP0689_2-20121128/50851_1 /TAXON_ID=160604 /ORGANISM="Amphidinium massartii, Strain CS-259" /LENGTH=798 /DNA_ID=CAMNT_0020091357 /DNA_START=64 /DNA_END=2460 /DNA_ORIENTATION=+
MAVAAGSILAALANAAWLYSNASSTHECVFFRTEFDLSSVPTAATVGFAAAGYGEVWINGEKADKTAVLEPSWTQWNKRLLVPSYEVASLLRQGIGLALGAGWYGHLKPGSPAIKAALMLEAAGAQGQEVLTSGSWTTGKCPITYNDIYNGETHDARLEQTDWASVGGGKGWLPAKASAQPPAHTEGATLSLQNMPAIRMLNLRPVRELVTITPNGSAILDFGVNLAGWVRLSIKDCSAGTVITLRHGESLLDDRSGIFVENLRSAKATDVYTCKGGPVKHEPHFVYHGFRFVEMTVKGPAEWSWVDQSAREVHSAVEPRGELHFENKILMGIQRAIVQTQLDNLHSVPTDCPQRDERQGWMADAAVSAEQAILNFNMKDFYVNFLQVIVDAQDSGNEFGDCKMPKGINATNATLHCQGAVTDTSPHMPGTFGQRPADPAWGVALPLISWHLVQHYGEKLTSQFAPAIGAWADFLFAVRAANGVVTYHYYGDWLQPGKVPSTDLISSMTAGFSAIQAVHIATKLGAKQDQQRHAENYETMRSDYMKAYWDSTKKWFGDGTQAAQVFALHLGGLSAEQDAAAWSRLLGLLAQQGLDTGIIATKWLFPLLSKRGRTDLGLRLASNTAYPSWGYEIAKDATTIWEHWDAFGHGTSQGMNSQNHPCFTSVGAWFYTDLLGIRIGPDSLELGTTLDEYSDSLPSARGSVSVGSERAIVEWTMRPEVRVKGFCPMQFPKAGCTVRVPLDGLSFESVAPSLQKQPGAGKVEKCGKAACVAVQGGKFEFVASKEPETTLSVSLHII